MELHVWVGDFGLASLSTECIKAIMYVKLSGAPVRIVYAKNPYLVFHGDFPVFRHGRVAITHFDDMVRYLRTLNYAVDYGLSGKQISEAYAFTNLIFSALHPLLQYVFWVDTKNYEELTSLWFSKVVHVPFNFLYPRRKRRAALSFLDALYPREEDPAVIRDCIESDAVGCLSCLVSRLGQNEYFYGNTLTLLDIIAYSYLAPLLKIPFPSKDLNRLVHSCPELVKYVMRIDEKIFPQINFDIKYIDRDGVGGLTADDEEDVQTSLSTKVLISVATATAMLGYAVAKRMIDMDTIQRILYYT